MAEHRHAPADCPVCGDQLIITRKGCTTCGTELVGEFANCSYCNLTAAEHELLRVFLASRGNLKEVEKHLGVSYPTARARYDALLAKLDLGRGDVPADDTTEPPQAAPSAQEQILARVAAGDIGSEEAARLIAAL